MVFNSEPSSGAHICSTRALQCPAEQEAFRLINSPKQQEKEVHYLLYSMRHWTYFTSLIIY